MLRRGLHLKPRYSNYNSHCAMFRPPDARFASRNRSLYHQNKTNSSALDASLIHAIEANVHTRSEAAVLQRIELMREQIVEHAALRVDLFFYLLVALHDKQVNVAKDATIKQHGKGSIRLHSHACHHSLFPNLKLTPILAANVPGISLNDTYFEDALNSTSELDAIVNGFDGHLEGRCKPSKWVSESLDILNLNAQAKIDPQAGMNMFFPVMHDFFSSSHEVYFNAATKQTAPAAKIKVLEYEKHGTFLAANSDLSVRDEYLFLMLRLKPEEIREISRHGGSLHQYHIKIQDEIYHSRAEAHTHTVKPR